MYSGYKYVLIWLSILLVGALSFIYKFFPDGDTLHIGEYSIYLPFFEDWPTFVYHMSILVIPALVSIVAIVVLPKSLTSRSLLFLFGLVLFINSWFIWHMLDRLRNIEGHSTLMTIVVASVVVFGVFLIRKYRGNSEREKRLKLMALLDQVNKEDLPAIKAQLERMKNATEDMKEHHYSGGWKRLIKEETEISTAITEELSAKVERARKEQG